MGLMGLELRLCLLLLLLLGRHPSHLRHKLLRLRLRLRLRGGVLLPGVRGRRKGGLGLLAWIGGWPGLLLLLLLWLRLLRRWW